MVSLYMILSPFSACPWLIGSYGIKLSEKASFAPEFQSLTYKGVGADKVMLCADSKHGSFLETLSFTMISFKSTLRSYLVLQDNTLKLRKPNVTSYPH